MRAFLSFIYACCCFPVAICTGLVAMWRSRAMATDDDDDDEEKHRDDMTINLDDDDDDDDLIEDRQ
jgi:hypothetical protein